LSAIENIMDEVNDLPLYVSSIGWTWNHGA